MNISKRWDTVNCRFFFKIKKEPYQKVRFFLAEQEGFEPSVPFWGTHDFQSCPL